MTAALAGDRVAVTVECSHCIRVLCRFSGSNVAIARLCPNDCNLYIVTVDCIPGNTNIICCRLPFEVDSSGIDGLGCKLRSAR